MDTDSHGWGGEEQPGLTEARRNGGERIKAFPFLLLLCIPVGAELARTEIGNGRSKRRPYKFDFFHS